MKDELKNATWFLCGTFLRQINHETMLLSLSQKMHVPAIKVPEVRSHCVEYSTLGGYFQHLKLHSPNFYKLKSVPV